MDWQYSSEKYVDQVVQTNEQGEIIVYPYGLFGRGYLLPAGEEQTFRDRLSKATYQSLTMASAFGLPVAYATRVGYISWPVQAAIWSAILAGILYSQWQLAAGLQPAPNQVPIGERLRRARQARPPWTYWYTIGFGLFLVPLGVGTAAIANGNWLVIPGSVMMMVLGVYGVIDGVLGLIERSRSK
ncbi:MAG: hypothetical protein WDN31_04275 [Hyphomicrobium sp.]